MFCPNCGTELVAGAKFCGECGHKIEMKSSAANAGIENERRGNHTRQVNTHGADLNYFARQKNQMKWWFISFSALSILLMFFHWVHFVGNLDVSYSPLTLHDFVEDCENFLYWILFDIWNHDGAEHFGTFAYVVRWISIIAIISNIVAIWAFLTNRRGQYYIGGTAAALSETSALIFLVWMWWFKLMLVKYDDEYFDISDVFHFTVVPYIMLILSGAYQRMISKHQKKMRKRNQLTAAEKLAAQEEK